MKKHHLCPECRDHKPRNCTGWTLNDDDVMIPCTTPTQALAEAPNQEDRSTA